jgi:CBS domain-containing protein
MTVSEIMNKNVGVSAPTDDLGTPIAAMKAHNCGFVPVVDADGFVTGVITDRDICLALASHPTRSASRIAVSDTMSRPVFSCLPDENLKVALGTMAAHHVRRLPVLSKEGHLMGVLSIDDIVRAPRRRGSPTSDEIVNAMKLIGAPRGIVTAVA